MNEAFEAELRRDLRAPRIARRRIRGWLTMVGEDELRDATILASELVSNAVRHGRGRIKLQVRVDDDRVLVEVIDEGEGLAPSIRDRDLEKVGGWGLRAVDAAASRWGAYEGTTHVWFELDRR